MKEIDLLNRRILYIGLMDWHYDIKMVEKLIELGAIVDSFNLGIFSRIINKLTLSNVHKYLYDLNKQLFLKKDYDYVLVHYAMQFDGDFFTKLRRLNPNAKFINFHWDPIEPGYDYTKTIKYFDKVYSFDYKDCQDYSNIKYLPLFYLDEYEKFRINKINIKKEIDVLFIGNWTNYKRYHLVKKIENLCSQNKLRFYFYLYFSFSIQSIIYIIRKGIIPYESKHKLLSHNEILNLFAITNTVIDFPSSFQSGLTMRTFETLGAGKKLITINKNIRNEPFYDPEYISILDINNLKLDVDFIRHAPLSSIGEKINDYSIKNYINRLLQ